MKSKGIILFVILVICLLCNQNFVYAKQGDSIKHAINISSDKISGNNTGSIIFSVG